MDALKSRLIKIVTFLAVEMKPSKKCKSAGLKSLAEYIDRYFDGNQRSFARAQGVQPPQVTQWLDKDFIVIDHVMYSKRRELSDSDPI